MLGRVQRAIGERPGLPLRDVAASLDPEQLPTIDPATGAAAGHTAVAP
jgi:hypothetical protein